MTKDEIARLKSNLQHLPHTPLPEQVELLKSDVSRLLAELTRLKTHLAALNEAQVALLQELQATANESYRAGSSAMRQSVLDACCPECTKAVISLTNERIPQ